MKRFLLMLVIVAMIATGTAFAQDNQAGDYDPDAEENAEILIYFPALIEDWTPPATDNNQDPEPSENEATLIDFSEVAGAAFTEEERALMKTSLAISNWEVDLNSSSQFTMTQANSLIRPATVRETADQFANETVMGLRVNFPSEPYNGWALVRPPFEIPAYMDRTTVDEEGNLVVSDEEEGQGRKFDGYGVRKNVGTIRQLQVWVHGLNFPHGMSVILMDENNETQEVFMGYLDFNGWRQLTWENPNYIQNVRNRELRSRPLYPNLAPMRKLIGFRIYRDAEMTGGDFISYVRDVRMTYDRAVLDLERDIDDEQVWGILQERESARRQAELRRLGELQVLRFLERQLIEAGEFSPDNDPANGGNGEGQN
jgi:hypothetical protein